MADKEVIREVREVRSDEGFENILLALFIAAVIIIAIWAFATDRLNFPSFTSNNEADTTNTNQTTPPPSSNNTDDASDVNVQVDMTNPTNNNQWTGDGN